MTNEERAEEAARCIRTMRDYVGFDGGSDDDGVVDLVANLMHLCDVRAAQSGVDAWERILASATMHYEAEVREEREDAEFAATHPWSVCVNGCDIDEGPFSSAEEAAQYAEDRKAANDEDVVTILLYVQPDPSVSVNGWGSWSRG
jgi:hypothetical protein